MKVRESKKAPMPTQSHTELVVETPTILVSTTLTTNLGLVIHKHSLFGTMIPFNLIALLPDQSSATMLNNFYYNLKLARSIVPILDRQFVIRKGMVNNLNKLLDMNLKVCLSTILIFSC